MHRFHLTVLAALVGLALACAPTRQPANALVKVLVYNIHAGKDAKGVDNLPRVAELIRATGADIALLQEVDVGTRRSGRVDQPEVLSELTGLRSSFGSTLDYDGGKYGIAVLTRWSVQHDTLFGLRVTPRQRRAGGSYEPRGVLHVLIATPFGPIHVLNTHLDPGRDDGYRRQEAAGVLRLADQLRSSGEPVVIGGDLNAEPPSAVMALFADEGWVDAWGRCGESGGNSFPAAAPIKRIDYLLLGVTATCERAEVLESQASDHRPILFHIRVSR